MTCKWKMLLALICVCCSCCLVACAEQQETPGNFADPCAVKGISERKDTANNLPRWIEKEKIRAGFLYAKDNTKYATLMRSHGFNTVIMSGFVNRKYELPKVIKDYRRWARACQKEGLHVFASCYWQPAPKSWSPNWWPYREVVYSDGTVGKAPCPRDREFWHNYLIHVGKIFARLSLDPDLHIDGVFLDCELYGSPISKKRHYGEHTCFCDNCFSSFLLGKGHTGQQLPAVGYGGREKWLKKNGFLDSYFAFLESDVEKLAHNFEKEIHAINPEFVLGMYPTPKNWVLKSIARGMGNAAMPMVLFGTDTYSNRKTAKVPDKPRQFYARERINAVYTAGYLLRKYSSKELAKQLPAVCRKCSGYWLFKIPMLWEPPYKLHKLASGSADEYWGALKKANMEIDEFNKTVNAGLNDFN